ncbi:probable disease resistance protein RPP1 [Cornus florida]|uniref:probable disease resistance protein RPP1 n=1 Tax=Cornus florida TaxID=4283 RepID=UPI00289C54DD|nr:probable disease resistance protein RPP1 [Cornus florida]
MERLRLLQLDFVHLSGSYQSLSGILVWLSWKGFSLKCVPPTLIMDNLVAIDLSYSKLKQVWRGTKVLGKLKYLYLSYSCFLIKTPDFMGFTSLEKLLLNGCTKLVEVHQSIGRLENLLVLDLNNCQNLEKIPLTIFMLKSVIEVNLSGCSKLQWPTYFQRWPLESSFSSLQLSSSLRKIVMNDCNITHVPIEIGRLMSLEYLNLSRNKFSNLPATISTLPLLKVLQLDDCGRLESIGDLAVNLLRLRVHCCALQSISMESEAGEAEFMTCYHCPILVNNNLAYNFRRNILRHPGLREIGQYSIVVPGSEIPRWCNYQSDGNVISFRVPQLAGRILQGYILCVAFSGSWKEYLGSQKHTRSFNIVCEFLNKTMMFTYQFEAQIVGFDHLRIEDHPRVEDQMWLTYVPNQLHYLWRCLHNYMLYSGDEMEITVRDQCNGWSVNKCGVCLVYKDDEKDPNYDAASLHPITIASEFPPVDENELVIKSTTYGILCEAHIFNHPWYTRIVKD